MTRKGQLGIQFHWVFTLIGGILFLLFFFVLIRSVLHSDQARTTRELSFDVGTIIAKAPLSPDTFSVADVPDATYRFACEQDAQGGVTYSYVRIDNQSYEDTGLRDIAVFSPATVRGDQLFTATATWQAPFPIASMVLLSNNRTRYVLVGLPQVTKRFVDQGNLGGFNILYVGPGGVSSVTDEGFDRYRFIYFGGYTAPPSAFLTARNSALVVHQDPDGETGTLDFHDSLAPGAPSPPGVPYAGEAMLAAAAFTDSYAAFRCNMAKAEGSLATAKKILLDRLKAILALYDAGNSAHVPDGRCQADYLRGKALIEAYPSPGEESAYNAYVQQGNLRELEDIDSRLVTRGCPRLY